jgi:hypothetical protein
MMELTETQVSILRAVERAAHSVKSGKTLEESVLCLSVLVAEYSTAKARVEVVVLPPPHGLKGVAKLLDFDVSFDAQIPGVFIVERNR